MKHTYILSQLRAHKPYLAREFGVTDLALFGSYARDEGKASSDLDLLVGNEQN
mgnify:FL=1